MAHYRTSFVTTTPIDAAFAYLSRFSSAVEWDPGVVESNDLTPEPIGRGSKFEIISSFLGRRVPLTYEIIDYNEPALVRLRAENASVRSTDTITFEADTPGTTKVTYDAELAALGAARLLSPLLTLAFGKIGDRAAEGLRTAVDGLSGPTNTSTTDRSGAT